jgi:hypothetical protein
LILDPWRMEVEFSGKASIQSSAPTAFPRNSGVEAVITGEGARQPACPMAANWSPVLGFDTGVCS